MTVEEQLTGRRQNVSSDVILHKHKYKMELVRSPEYFKPGLIYKGFVCIFFIFRFLENVTGLYRTFTIYQN